MSWTPSLETRSVRQKDLSIRKKAHQAGGVQQLGRRHHTHTCSSTATLDAVPSLNATLRRVSPRLDRPNSPEEETPPPPTCLTAAAGTAAGDAGTGTGSSRSLASSPVSVSVRSSGVDTWVMVSVRVS